MAKSFKRTIYKTNKYSFTFFMYEPQVEVSTKGNYSISANPCLMFQFAEDFLTNRDLMAPQNKYMIYPRTICKVTKFFNNILSWFSDPNMKDLFMLNHENQLIFNADYRELSEKIDIKTSAKDYGVLRAIPTVGTSDTMELFEGIYLYMNISTNKIIMPKEEISMIVDILSSFSFYDEMNISLLAIKYAMDNKQIRSGSGNFNSGYSYNSTPIKTPFDK